MTQSPIPSSISRIAPDGNLSPRQKRRFMIEMLKRRVRPGTGSGVDFLLRRTAMNIWPDLRPILKGVNWLVVGGVATRNYMPERMTRDLDILIREKDEKAVIAKLESAGYKQESQLSIPGILMLSPEGVEVDVLLGSEPWLEDALKNAVSDPAGYPTIALPYLILLKMNAQRAQDWADVSRMLGWASDEDLNKVRAVFETYAPADVEDLESLIFIGKKERE
ncbi:MAG: hypothetical protein JNK32_01970 [Anaerolineales bacterium]|nr:hypothetical protein [Anaerolineales bacterium]